MPIGKYPHAATRQRRNVAVSPLVEPKSYHSHVETGIRLLGRFASSRRKRETEGRRTIYFQQLMANPQLRLPFIEVFTLLALAQMFMEW